MPDYGHDLQFGFFLDPTTGTPERTIEIARILDDLGYDLIGIQARPLKINYKDKVFSACCGAPLVTAWGTYMGRIGGRPCGGCPLGCDRGPIPLARPSARGAAQESGASPSKISLFRRPHCRG